tara:strand:- start:2758 stop:4149 length:1392 start_codon:yes stop_codon:yes gene_type:complete
VWKTKQLEKWLLCKVCTFLLASFLTAPLFADDWPQWMGPQRDGVWRETGILESFPETGLPRQWHAKLGAGYAGPAVAGGRVIVMDRIRHPDDAEKIARLKRDFGPAPNYNYTRGITLGVERVVALDVESGKVQWVHQYDCPYTTALMYGAGPRVTPTVDQDRVYTLGSEGHLFCLQAKTGQVIWSREFQRDYKLEIPHWGVSAHPLVDGDRLICTVGGKGTTVVAFDKYTGREIWRALDARWPGYSSPVIYQVGQTRQLVVWHGDAINGLNPETGATYWSIPIKTHWGMAIGIPRLFREQLYVSGYPRQSALLQLNAQRPQAEIVWQGDTRRGVACVMSTPMIEGGYLYGAGPGGRFMCIRLSDGKPMWESFAPSTGKRPASWANVFIVKQADRYLLANDLGELVLARLSPDGFEQVSRTKIIAPTTPLGRRTVVWSHPAFAQRSVFARNDKELVRLSLAANP